MPCSDTPPCAGAADSRARPRRHRRQVQVDGQVGSPEQGVACGSDEQCCQQSLMPAVRVCRICGQSCTDTWHMAYVASGHQPGHGQPVGRRCPISNLMGHFDQCWYSHLVQAPRTYVIGMLCSKLRGYARALANACPHDLVSVIKRPIWKRAHVQCTSICAGHHHGGHMIWGMVRLDSSSSIDWPLWTMACTI